MHPYIKQRTIILYEISQVAMDNNEELNSPSQVLSFRNKDESHKVIAILGMEKKERTNYLLRIAQQVLENNVQYIQKLKSKIHDDNMTKLIQALQIEEYAPMEVLFNQGETGRKMYIILQGEVVVCIKSGESDSLSAQVAQTNAQKRKKTKTFEDYMAAKFPNQKIIAIKRKYDHFGEIAIEQRIPRTASVITRTVCTFAVLTYESFQKLLRDLLEEAIEIRREVIKEVPPFNQLELNQLQQLLHHSEEILLPAKAILYKKNQSTDAIYVVISGEVLVQRWDKACLQEAKDSEHPHKKEQLITLGLFGQGQVVGDYELYLWKVQADGLSRKSQAVTQTECKLLKINLTTYLDIMNQYCTTLQQFLTDKFRNRIMRQNKMVFENAERYDDILQKIKNSYAQSQQRLIEIQRHIQIQPSLTHAWPISPRQRKTFYVSRSKGEKLKSEINLKDKAILKYITRACPLKLPKNDPMMESQIFSTGFYAKRVKRKITQYREYTEDSKINISSCRILPRSEFCTQNELSIASPAQRCSTLGDCSSPKVSSTRSKIFSIKLNGKAI